MCVGECISTVVAEQRAADRHKHLTGATYEHELAPLVSDTATAIDSAQLLLRCAD
jgi:hypothetical protein